MITRVVALLCLISLASCSSIEPAKIVDGAALSGVRSAYVVQHEESKEGIPQALQDALVAQGVRATHGGLASKPAVVDATVTYVDRWQWDVGMYLASLDVEIRMDDTNALIASGRFKNSPFLHSFPRAAGKSVEVIESIFEANAK